MSNFVGYLSVFSKKFRFFKNNSGFFKKVYAGASDMGQMTHWADSSMHSNFLSCHPFQFCSKLNYICPLFDIKFIPPVNSV